MRDFCWEMAEKYKRNSPVRDVFLNNLKGKLGEEVVKARLGNIVTEVDYEKRIGGDGKVDFRLTCVPSIGIQVKARHGSIDTIQWSISKEEAEKNAALICILIHEEVNEAQTEYNLIVAGFLPTSMIGVSNVKTSLKIDELLYSGGLHSYLGSLSNYINLGKNGFEKGDYLSAIANYNQALQLNPKYVDAYVWRGVARYKIEDKQGAIEDWTEVIKIIPNYADVHRVRGLARHEIGDEQGAILDYTETLRMNPNDAEVYFERGVARSALKDYEGAFQDYTQAIKINPNYAEAYYQRGNINITERWTSPFDDFYKALEINPDYVEAYCGLAHCCYAYPDDKGTNIKLAIEYYTKAININPNYTQAYLNRAIALSAVEDHQGAIEDYTQAIRINPNSVKAYINRSYHLCVIGNKRGAINDLQKAVVILEQQTEPASYQKAKKISREIGALYFVKDPAAYVKQLINSI